MVLVDSAKKAYEYLAGTHVLLLNEKELDLCDDGYIAGYSGKYVIIGYHSLRGCICSFTDHNDLVYDDKYASYRFAKLSKIVIPDKKMEDYKDLYLNLWKEVISI